MITALSQLAVAALLVKVGLDYRARQETFSAAGCGLVSLGLLFNGVGLLVGGVIV